MPKKHTQVLLITLCYAELQLDHYFVTGMSGVSKNQIWIMRRNGLLEER